MPTLKYALPPFLERHGVDRTGYERWLRRKAAAHLKRDRKRHDPRITGAAYRAAIHEAVIRSGGRDAYTGEELHWHLISQYKNEEAKAGRHGYKASFGLLPTVDHLEASSLSASFRICAWRTNDAKHDLSVEAFVELCGQVLKHAGYRVENGS